MVEGEGDESSAKLPILAAEMRVMTMRKLTRGVKERRKRRRRTEEDGVEKRRRWQEHAEMQWRTMNEMEFASAVLAPA